MPDRFKVVCTMQGAIQVLCFFLPGTVYVAFFVLSFRMGNATLFKLGRRAFRLILGYRSFSTLKMRMLTA